MRRFHLTTLLLAVFVLVSPVPGQDKNEKKSPAAVPDPNAVEVHFADDSTVKMSLQHNAVEIVTRYGKLTVPVTEIRRIDFGIRIPEETAKRIETAIARLAGSDFKLREAGGRELLELREVAYPSLQQAARSGDAEVSRRAKELVKTLVDTVPAEKLHLPHHDTVTALDFTIVGRIEGPTLKARTPYFGETSLKLAEVRSMRWLANEHETKTTVDAARYGSQQEAWLDTGVDIRAGAGLQIAANGRVDLQPQSPGQLVVTPDGLPTARTGRGGGQGFPGAAPNAPGGFGGRAARQFSDVLSPGALLGRVGEYGKPFVIGSRFEGPAGEDGKLYLRIAASPYNGESSGTYEVRVITGR
jgi:hypothetical protein